MERSRSAAGDIRIGFLYFPGAEQVSQRNTSGIVGHKCTLETRQLIAQKLMDRRVRQMLEHIFHNVQVGGRQFVFDQIADDKTPLVVAELTIEMGHQVGNDVDARVFDLALVDHLGGCPIAAADVDDSLDRVVAKKLLNHVAISFRVFRLGAGTAARRASPTMGSVDVRERILEFAHGISSLSSLSWHRIVDCD